MRRSLVRASSCTPFLAGLCVVLGAVACGSKNDNTNTGTTGPLGTGGAAGAVVGPVGTGGSTPPVGSGGTTSTGPTGSGGVTSPGTGGSIISGGGGIVGGGGATSAAGAAGAANGGTTGTAGASGGGGMGGSVTLADCDQKSESAAMPATQACGSMTTVLGKKVTFGPAGAIMDVNVGKGFENTDPNDNATCPLFAATFNEPADETKQLLDVGTQPCNAPGPNMGKCLDFKLYSTYRPATWPEGKIPVIAWANGTCAQPEGYGPLLRYVASYGFFIVAPNSREVGTGKEPLHALDFAKAANEDMSSPYYGHLDLTKVGVMGHSQGGASTIAAASDPRVKAVIIFNGGNSASKPFLAISGDMDITGATAASMGQAVNAAPQGAFLYYHNPAGAMADTIKGHLVLMLTPERVTGPTVAWWQMMLNGDATAKQQFVGMDCGLCKSASDYNFGEHGL